MKPHIERSPSTTSEYHVTTLPNEVGVAVKPMPQAQSVSVGVWVKAGGRYETPERAGISHVLEHLLFKGTRRRSCEALKQRIEGVGGTFECVSSPGNGTKVALRVHIRAGLETNPPEDQGK